MTSATCKTTNNTQKFSNYCSCCFVERGLTAYVEEAGNLSHNGLTWGSESTCDTSEQAVHSQILGKFTFFINWFYSELFWNVSDILSSPELFKIQDTAYHSVLVTISKGENQSKYCNITVTVSIFMPTFHTSQIEVSTPNTLSLPESYSSLL